MVGNLRLRTFGSLVTLWLSAIARFHGIQGPYQGTTPVCRNASSEDKMNMCSEVLTKKNAENAWSSGRISL